MAVVVAVVVLVVAAATYLTWTATRLDRLHARVDASAAALDAELVRRAAIAADLAAGDVLTGPHRAWVAQAATDARTTEGLGPAREQAENALSRALRAALPAVAAGPAGPARLAELRVAAERVGYARRFHNDAVSDTLAIRGRRIPRLAHLAGSAPTPVYFEMDDTAALDPAIPGEGRRAG